MLFEKLIAEKVTALFPELFNNKIEENQLTFQPTRKEFVGDITLVVFGLTKLSGTSPEKTGHTIGEALVNQSDAISQFNVVKGFLNIEINNNLWLSYLHDLLKQSVDKFPLLSGNPVLIEYSSPNTNKPLHLGHIRNNLLGYSLSEILKFNGSNVVKVNVINDRGIHICKSMVAWKKYGNSETPQSSGIKGDHLVGKYYVAFDKNYKTQIDELVASGMTKEDAEKQAPLILEARKMLKLWEEGDSETLDLWNMMNGWVYEGFDETYKRLGVDFDQLNYESQTYLLGKKLVEKGLKSNVLYQKSDGSVWIDLKDEGLDEKLLLRADGTSVYMTQDLGTAVTRFEKYGFEKMIYVVGNEQDYHFKVLFLILKKLGYEWASKLYHLCYNMVDLPSGKMKSREGTVVDADELIDKMISEAKRLSMELGKLDDFESESSNQLYDTIGLGALKYFILKVDPEKRMLFNPDESIDFNGNTGPFIQYTHARIKSVIRKADTLEPLKDFRDFDIENYSSLIPKEKELLKIMVRFKSTTVDAAIKLSPAVIASYAYELAKNYNQFYHDHPIADSDNIEVSKFRLRLSLYCSELIATSMKLLGITVPDKM